MICSISEIWLCVGLIMTLELTGVHSKVVATKLGKMIGSEYNVPDAGKIYSFLKVPYALPPTGPLRFTKPVPFGAWTSILDARDFGPSCMQPISSLPPDLTNKDTSEDCLHLNIFVPYDMRTKTPKSVMVWIHGGDYTSGRASMYDGTYLALSGGVIVVTLNYRLGALGFLSTGDDDIQGNFGLWDQHLALKWINENIASFGGDPNSVTIFGKSAGGSSVSFQSLFPGNQGMFQRVISQSGVATSVIQRSDQSKVKVRAKEFIEGLKCPTGNRTALLSCLRDVPAESFVRVFEDVISPERFLPVVDGDFITDYAEKILQSENSDAYKFFTSLDLMVGGLDGDGTAEVSKYLTPEVMARYKINIENGVPTDFLCKHLSPAITRLAISKYPDESFPQQLCEIYKKKSSTKALANSVIDLLTDIGTTFPSLEIADFHYARLSNENYSSTFVYTMKRVSKRQNMFFPESTYPWLQRAVHDVDFMYLFAPEVFFIGADDDLTLGKRMQKYWTNFAKSGNPNSEHLPFWPQYGYTGRILVMDKEINHQNRSELFGKRRSEFWLDKVFHRKVTIEAKLGTIKGTLDQKSGFGSIYRFRDIPYAKPPVGHLRFRKPVQFGSWHGVLDATKFGPRCMHAYSTRDKEIPNISMSEDCLKLNIFVPYDLDNVKKRSVLIWILEGSSFSGVDEEYDGSMMALREDIIVVTINYRLGAFGFISTHDSASPGNFGLWDQHLAFQWIHDNIESFGGDQTSVTIGGSSLGGLYAISHSLYPGNMGLFQRVISENGVGLTKLIVSSGKKDSPLTSYLSEFGCYKINTTKAIHCLRSFPAAALVKSTPFLPVIDNNFISSNFTGLRRESNASISKMFASVDLMLGLNTGNIFNIIEKLIPRVLMETFNKAFIYNLNVKYSCEKLAGIISERLHKNDSKIATEICRLYKSESSLESTQSFPFNLFSDIFYMSPTIECAKMHERSADSKTFMYVVNKTSPSFENLDPNSKDSKINMTTGGLSVVNLFDPSTLLEANRTDEYYKAIELMKYMGNFIQNGDTNGNDVSYWPEYGNDSMAQVLGHMIKPGKMNISQKMEFWLETAPRLMSKKDSNIPKNKNEKEQTFPYGPEYRNRHISQESDKMSTSKQLKISDNKELWLQTTPSFVSEKDRSINITSGSSSFFLQKHVTVIIQVIFSLLFLLFV